MKYLAKLDIKSAYNQILIEDKFKEIITTRRMIIKMDENGFWNENGNCHFSESNSKRVNYLLIFKEIIFPLLPSLKTH